MTWTSYRLGRLVTRFIILNTMRLRRVHGHIPDSLNSSSYILALSHQGHLDPFIASSLQNRPLSWMTRIEFFKFGWSRFLMRKINAFPVKRSSISVSSIRRAISIAGTGEAIGICPEGGVTCGDASCFRGGPIKRGVASISLRAQIPIVPCVLLGTSRLNTVKPWLPFKHANIWIIYGEPIYPPRLKSTRQTRAALISKLTSSYVSLYNELTQTSDVDPAWVA